MAFFRTKYGDAMIEASKKARAIHIGVSGENIRGFVSFLDDRRTIVRLVCYAAAALLPLARHRRRAEKRAKAARRR